MHKFSNRGLLNVAVLGHPNLAAALPVSQAARFWLIFLIRNGRNQNRATTT